MTAASHLVVGLGQTGWSCVRYLHQQGFTVLVVDSRAKPPYADKLIEHYADVQTHFGELNANLWTQPNFLHIHTALVSPGVDTRTDFFQAARARAVDICGDIEWYARHHQQPVVAITATNGKSTVTDWLGFVLTALNVPVTVAGNIGVPVLDVIQNSAAVNTIMLLELSSYQLETCQSLKPVAATLLNLAPDHLDRYADYPAYQSAKRHIYHNAAVAVLPADEPLCWPGNFDRATAISFGSEPLPPEQIAAANYWGLKNTTAIIKAAKAWRFAEELPLQGQHNVLNALAVLALLQALQQQGLIHSQPDDWWPVLLQYRGLPHRCQWIQRFADADWYDDSKATNVGAAVAAINGLGQSLPAPLIVILGGAGKQGADYREVIQACQRYAAAVIVMGAAAELLRTEFLHYAPAYAAHCYLVLDMPAAVQQALVCLQSATPAAESTNSLRQFLRPGAVLLSPACASFDQYNNYVERGQHFQQCLRSLAAHSQAD